MATIITPAVVLRAIDYGEADRIVTLLGRATGRISALARGARSSRRRFGGALDMAVVGEATLRERAGSELAQLERLDPRDVHPNLGADVARMAHAAYAVELCSKLCAPRQAEPGVFDLLVTFLARLDAGAARAERLRVFELALLRLLGHLPSIEACVVCGRVDLGDEESRWDPVRGGTVCRTCGRTGRLMRAEVRTALTRLGAIDPAAAEAESLPATVNAACRDAMLEVIGLHAGGPLRSVEFITKMGGG